ncbi:MAG: response regulator [Aristaeellaceae bacterium]
MKSRMILVDDETGQLAILSEIIEALAPDFEVISFSSPREVLQYLRQHQAHAVLCDIRMEEMDGLALCTQIHQLYPQIILGVISAYSDFHYAQAAIELGVKAYLTKPVSHEKLLDLLNKIRVQVTGAFGGAMPSGEHALTWAEFLTGAETVYPFPEVCSADKPAQLAMAAYLPGCLSKDRLKEALPDAALYFADLKRNRLLIAAFGQPSYFLRRFEELLRHAKWHMGGPDASVIPVRAAVVPVAGMDKRDWTEAYARLLRRMDASFAARPALMTASDPPDSGARPAPALAFSTLEQEALGALKHRDIAALRRMMQQFPAQIRRQDWQISENEYKSNLRHLLLSACRMTNHSFSAADMDALDQQLFLDTAVSYMLSVMEGMLSAHMSQMDVAANTLPQQLIDYVEEHYCEEISLESVADAFHLSPSYVSSLFKQQANKGFRKYIIDRRIEQAQKLLLTTDMKVYEIASRVGYLDSTSFVKLFEREVGLSPSRYRRMGKKP